MTCLYRPWSLRAGGAALALAAALGCAPEPGEEPPGRPGARMAKEASPYLRQHRDDEVDWHPWGAEAFRLAEDLDKPLFLSIGYSACHWCHVMQRQSFRSKEVAGVLNRVCVSIKLDREERPDVDAIYMDACRVLGVSGGWPLSAFLTPDRKPFLIRTYVPPEEFKELLLKVEEAWRDRRDQLESFASEVARGAAAMQGSGLGEGLAEPAVLSSAVATILATEDSVHGGVGTAPKFPLAPMALFMLRESARTADPQGRAFVKRLLDAMRRGGIHDQLGGGFHRYSTDRAWIVPHFEKMLPDQAMLARLYTEAYAAFGDPAYREVAMATLDFCKRELKSPGGGFMASLDAEVQGVEGIPYAWTMDEIAAVLPGELRDVAIARFGIAGEGSFGDGLHVLVEHRTHGEIAAELDLEEPEVAARIQQAVGLLRAERAKRPSPRADHKVITSWNALLASALAKAGRTFSRPDLVSDAVELAGFLDRRLRDGSGRLMRSLAEGGVRHRATLEDFSALLEAMLDVHEATLDLRWLERAGEIAEELLGGFAEEDGSLVDSRESDLIFPVRTLWDAATPAPVSLALCGLSRLAIMSGDEALLDSVRRVFGGIRKAIDSGPSRLPYALIALDLLHRPVARISVSLAPDTTGRPAFLSGVDRQFRPFTVVVRARGEEDLTEDAAVVCVGTRCLLPARTGEELDARIREALSGR